MKNLHKFIKMSGCKSEKEFYKRFASEEDFFKAHPEAKQSVPKAEMGYDVGDNNENIIQQFKDFLNSKTPTWMNAVAHPSDPLNNKGQNPNFSPQNLPPQKDETPEQKKQREYTNKLSKDAQGLNHWSDMSEGNKMQALKNLDDAGGNSSQFSGEMAALGEVDKQFGKLNSIAQGAEYSMKTGLMSFMNVLPEAKADHDPLRQLVDNQNAYGTGSQAIYENGGQLPNNMLGIQALWGGDIKQMSYNPYDGGTAMAEGASHENGGIGIQTNGQKVEVQGNEPLVKDQQGNTIVLGGIKPIGSNKTFQTMGKEIGKFEAKANKIMKKANKLKDNSPTAFVLEDKAKQELKMASIKKQNLIENQQAILDYAEALGIKPEKAAEKIAKSGMKISYDDGQTWNDNTKGIWDEVKPMKFDIPIPEKRNVQKFPVTILQSDIVHDMMGNKTNVPNLPNNWNRHQIDEWFASNPENGITNYNQYEPYMENGGTIPKADDGFKSWISDKESGGNYQAQNPNSTAAGKYQFLWGLRPGKGWQDEIKKVTGVQSKEEFLNNPKAQEDFMGYYEDHTLNPAVAALQQYNTEKYSEKQLKGLIHFKGVKGAKDWLTSKVDKTSKGNSSIEKYIGTPENTIYGENFRFDKQPTQESIVENKQPQWGKEMFRQVSGLPTKDAIPLVPTQDTPSQKLSSLADKNKLGIKDFLSDIPALFDRPDYVPRQEYQPRMYTPYQVSMQDSLDENNASFRSVAQQLSNNPEALAALAGQKYQADTKVLADQFRTNQGLHADIINKNTELLNNAQLQNNQYGDVQSVRQAQAKAIVEQNRHNALNDIQTKIASNTRDNNNIRLYENLFKYRPDANMNMEYKGDPASFNWNTNMEKIMAIDDSKARTAAYTAELKKYELAKKQAEQLTPYTP